MADLAADESRRSAARPVAAAPPSAPSLPELLGTLYRAHRNVDAMVAEVRDWSRQQADDVVVMQRRTGGGAHARWLDDGLYERSTVTTRRLWFQSPDQVRVEMLDAGVVVRVAVRNGSAWWQWDRERGESAGDLVQDPRLPLLLNLTLLMPVRLLCTMWFEVTGTGHRASRRVITARAMPRLKLSGPERRHSFEFDLEQGTPLYMATLDAGEPISVTEVLSIDYAATLNREVFAARAGTPARRGREHPDA